MIALAQLASLLGLALILGAIARRLGLPGMVGEIGAGIVLGPSLLGWVAPRLYDLLFDQHGTTGLVAALATLGVVLMVGLAATELDGGFLRSHTVVVASVTGWSFMAPLLLGVGAGVLLTELPATADIVGSPEVNAGPHTVQFALLLGTALSVSAIPVIARILVELDLLRRGVGQLILSAAALTDIGAWLLLAVVSAMATVGVANGHLAISVAALIGVIVVTWLMRRPVQRGIGALATRAPTNRAQSTRLPGAVLTVNIIAGLVMVGAAALTSALSLEAVLGAFLGGLLIGRRHTALLRPLRAVTNHVLAPLFLATAGLHLDARALADPVVLAIAGLVLVLAVVGKLAGTYVGARLVRVSRRHALALGAGLNARGVVEIVIANVGHRLGVFTQEVATIIVLVAIVTSLMAGPLLSWLLRHERRGEERRGAGAHPSSVIPNASSTVRNFADVSRNSSSGSDPSTMPPPAQVMAERPSAASSAHRIDTSHSPSSVTAPGSR